jgi:hypothetical protein
MLKLHPTFWAVPKGERGISGFVTSPARRLILPKASISEANVRCPDRCASKRGIVRSPQHYSAGLILPILHGTVFLLIGLAILSSEYLWAHRLLSKIRNRFPSVTVRLEQATTAAHEWISKPTPNKMKT